MADTGCQGPANADVDANQLSLHYTDDITARLLEGRDLAVKRLEGTQGLQDEANSIPLVQGRSTVVRAFLDNGTEAGPVDGVRGLLKVSAGGTDLGTLEPFNPKGRISAPSDPNWKIIDDTLNFELPLAWTQQPSLTIKVEVNPDHTVVESNYDNNDLSIAVSPRACSGISIGYTPIHYAPSDGVAADPSASIQAAQGFMQKIYPIPDNGLGDFNGSGAFGNDTEAPDKWRRTFAHEIGHNWGLDHPEIPLSLTTNGDH